MKRITLFVFVILMPVLLFSLKTTPHRWQLTTIAQEVIAPLEKLWHITHTFVNRSWNSYIDLSQVATENQQLKDEVARLRTRLLFYEEKETETLQLRRLLGFIRLHQLDMVVARVIARPGHFAFLSVRVDRGTNDGIAVAMPVVSADGVVGRIVRAGRNYADVQLLVDSDFHADVLVQRTRIRTTIRGNLDNCVLEMQRATELKIGDTIITSGIVDSFPKGVPVGEVVRISYAANTVAQQITVTPSVDHRQLEEVTILRHRSPHSERIATRQQHNL